MAINAVCWSRVKWEEMKRPPVILCLNCYDVGHSMSGGCFRPRQCKRCPEKGQHDCKVEKLPVIDEKGNEQNEYGNYTCCNCGQKGHPPTWAGCSWLKEKTERALEARNRVQHGKFAKFVDAPMVTSNPWTAPRSTPEARRPQVERGGASLEDLINQELGMSVDKVQEIANNFMAKYATMKTQADKRKAIAMYFLEIADFKP